MSLSTLLGRLYNKYLLYVSPALFLLAVLYVTCFIPATFIYTVVYNVDPRSDGIFIFTELREMACIPADETELKETLNDFERQWHCQVMFGLASGKNRVGFKPLENTQCGLYGYIVTATNRDEEIVYHREYRTGESQLDRFLGDWLK